MAHSKEEMTVPEDGATLSTSPTLISIVFDTPMRVTLLKLSDDQGERYDIERHTGLEAVTDFSVIPEELPAGRYFVEWRGLSADGHTMSGQFSFSIVD